MAKKNTIQRNSSSKTVPAAKPAAAIAMKPGNIQGQFLAGLVFLLPLIFSRATLDPTIVPRHLLLSFFITVMMLIFYSLKKNSHSAAMNRPIYTVFILGIAFALWNIIVSSVSINPQNGYFEIARLFLNMALLFLVLLIVSKNEGTITLVCKMVCLTGIIYAVIGIFQNFDLAFADLPGANSKPWGLNANRNLYGSALAFAIPFIGYTFYKSRKLWKIVSSVSLVLTTAALVISQTRSAWVATVSFLLVLLLLSIMFLRSETKKILRFAAVLAISAIAVASIIIVADSKGTLATELKQRGASFVAPSADSSQSDYSINDRVTIWKKTIELIKDKPAMGVGTSNWKISILGYGGKGTSWSRGNYVPDRVHNIYLQITAETGIPGLLLFLAFWIAVAYIGFKFLRSTATAERKVVVAFMMAGLAAVAADGMFSFPTERIEHSLYIMLMAGFILGMYSHHVRDNAGKKNAPKWFVWLAIIIGIAGIFMGLKRKQFEENIYQVKALEKLNRPNDLLIYAEKGKNGYVNLDPDGLAIENKEAIVYRDQKNYDKAIKTMEQAILYNPNSAMALNNMATIYTQQGNYKEAIKYLERALTLTPDFDIVKKNLVINYYNDKQLDKAMAIMETFDYKADTMFLDMYNSSKAFLEYQKANPPK